MFGAVQLEVIYVEPTIPYLNYVVIPASDALKPKKNCFLFAVFCIGILYLHIIFVHVVFVNPLDLADRIPPASRFHRFVYIYPFSKLCTTKHYHHVSTSRST